MEDLLVANEVLKDEIVALKIELQAQKDHAEVEKEAIREALKDRIIELELEISELKNNEMAIAQRDLLQIENSELHHRIAIEHEEIANLRDALDGMAEDMGQLEGLLADRRGDNE